MDFKIVQYNSNEFAVIKLKNDRLIVIDKDDLERIKDVELYDFNNYINGYFENDKQQYIHTFLMKTPDNMTVDHLTRNPRDNRKLVLKISTQSEQNHNTKRRARTVELPENCGISDIDIPRHVWYIHKNGKHGDGFSIQLKGYLCLGNKFTWKSTRSTSISLKDKLDQTISKLFELRETYDDLKSVIIILPEHEEFRKKITEEFNDIIKLSEYDDDIIASNIFNFVSDLYVPERKIKIELPIDSGITEEMIPENCKYLPGDEWRGDRFAIMNYAELTDTAKKYWYTSSNKSMPLSTKFDQLIDKLNNLSVVNTDNDE